MFIKLNGQYIWSRRGNMFKIMFTCLEHDKTLKYAFIIFFKDFYIYE